MLSLNLQHGGTDRQLRRALAILSEYFAVRESIRGGLAVEFRKLASANRTYRITVHGPKAVIEYSNLAAALRGVGRLMSEEKPPQREIVETTGFKTAGIMVDCSRNAVMKVEHFKEWLRRIALLGFNMAMLYTEDTYELPKEPYFGYQRGRYTADEVKEIDKYAADLGIEMIGCIQTLGHLEQILKWSEYVQIKDTPNVMLIGQKRTYELIEKMIRHFAQHYHSRRIHIGMDEAEHFGRGRYMDLHGYRPSFDLFNEHLAKVVKLCKKYGLEPMMWSDMYFALGSRSGSYYDKLRKMPAEIKSKIPREVKLVYWDYYHSDEAFYLEWIKRHRALGREPIMASGIWTWHSLWYDRRLTEQNAGACIRACKRAGVDEIFFTMWGDDGAYCDLDSALAGMAYVSELMYSDQVSQKILARRFDAICGGDYSAIRLASDVNMHEDIALGSAHLGHTSSAFFWDDPLLAIYYRNKDLQLKNFWPRLRTHYKKLAYSLAKKAGHEDIGQALILAKILFHKIDIRIELEKAYQRRNKKSLRDVSRRIPAIIELYSKLDRSFRRLWLARNKPQGLEVIQIRIAGLTRRYQELRQRLRELAADRIDVIDELEERPNRPLARVRGRFKDVVTSSSIL